MTGKILWITFLMTLTYWLGGSWGCAAPGEDQNYEILEEDAEMFDTEPRGLQSRADIARELNVALDDPYGRTEPVAAPIEPAQPALTVTEAPPLAVDRPIVTPPALEAVVIEPWPPLNENWESPQVVPPLDSAVVVLRGETQPSLNGLDRSHWRRTTVGPAESRTAHGPIYFEDLRLGDRRKATTADPEGDAAINEAEFLAAMEGRGAKGIIGAGNAADLVVQPVKFGVDLVLLPVRAVLEPPFITTVTTPTTLTDGQATDTHDAAPAADAETAE